MKLKHKINILGQDISIKFRDKIVVKGYIKKKKEWQEDICDGCFDPSTNTIYLDKNIKGSKLDETLLHEIIECILTLLNLEINHPDLSRLSTSLYAVLRGAKLIKPLEYSNIIIDPDNTAIKEIASNNDNINGNKNG